MTHKTIFKFHWTHCWSNLPFPKCLLIFQLTYILNTIGKTSSKDTCSVLPRKKLPGTDDKVWVVISHKTDIFSNICGFTIIHAYIWPITISHIFELSMKNVIQYRILNSISQFQTIHEKFCVQFQGYKKYNDSKVSHESLTAPKKFSGKSPGRVILYIEYLHILHILESMCDHYGCFELCLWAFSVWIRATVTHYIKRSSYLSFSTITQKNKKMSWEDWRMP